jgi:hypothetical protein
MADRAGASGGSTVEALRDPRRVSNRTRPPSVAGVMFGVVNLNA